VAIRPLRAILVCTPIFGRGRLLKHIADFLLHFLPVLGLLFILFLAFAFPDQIFLHLGKGKASNPLPGRVSHGLYKPPEPPAQLILRIHNALEGRRFLFLLNDFEGPPKSRGPVILDFFLFLLDRLFDLWLRPALILIGEG